MTLHIPLYSGILPFQTNADHNNKHNYERSQGTPGQQHTMYCIRLAKSREERPIEGAVVAKERVSTQFVTVQAKRCTQSGHCPARWEDHRRDLQDPLFQWDLGSSKDHLRDEYEREKAICSVLVGSKGGGGKPQQHAGEGG